MPELTKWQWWYGDHDSVVDDGLYSIDHESREQALATGLRETAEGDSFFIVEARSYCALAGGDEDPDEFQPFAEMRNRACFEIRDGAAVEVENT